ncbi:MAG: hypothetical protein QMD20_04050 [Candidatus Bathyarchaeia archaeon]|nr:hypothetical protein [Candidatus Bathyarchaeia archaeon]
MVEMVERKQKHETQSIIELEAEESGFVLEPAQVEVGSGFTVFVSYDENEKPIIDVKTYGEVNLTKLRREIERIFPNAKIRQLTQTSTVTVVKKRKKKKK